MERDCQMRSARLTYRPLAGADASRVAALVGDWDIARMTSRIPHPYSLVDADLWIASLGVDEFVRGVELDGALIGAVGYIEGKSGEAEIGYWIGKPFWNRGYATEAAIAVIRFGFASLDLNRIASRHFSRNPASGRVMQKAGLRHEGTARQSMIKWGKYEDLQLYAILREDWSGP